MRISLTFIISLIISNIIFSQTINFYDAGTTNPLTDDSYNGYTNNYIVAFENDVSYVDQATV